MTRVPFRPSTSEQKQSNRKKRSADMPCDLHTHSHYSDGSYSPKEIIDEARARGLSAVALTDHNTASGLPEFIEYARAIGQTAVAGAELSCEFDTGSRVAELHMLALFLPEESWSTVNECNGELMRRKHEAYLELERALAEDGIMLDYEALVKKCRGLPNRANIAEELVSRGYVKTIKEAFGELLKSHGKYYTPPHYPDVFSTIELITGLGALPVLAHPFLNLSEEELTAFLPVAKARGLVGMETEYSKYDEETTRLSYALAERFGLLMSGGSDFHGTRKPDISLGVGRGELSVPDGFYRELLSIKEKKS
jgi:predicted metal-dependent phosphoesterase TrpH